MTLSTGPDDWDWWWGKWRDRIRCGTCLGLMDIKAPCPICGCDYRSLPPTEHVVNGKVIAIPLAFAGALDWAPYVMLQLMYREWSRPLEEESCLAALPQRNRPSRRLLLVLTFWTYFETLMSWFYETATDQLPNTVAADLLARYSFIGARIGRLHRILFNTTYGQDLDQLGFSSIRQHLEIIQKQRNAFMHGNPESISDSLVKETVTLIPAFHEGWIECFNMRCAKQSHRLQQAGP